MKKCQAFHWRALKKLALRCSGIFLHAAEDPCSFASTLSGLLPEFPCAPEMTQDLRKSRSSLLNHIFSTIPAIKPSSAQNWVCSCSGPQGLVVEKISFALRAPFPNSQGSEGGPRTTAFPKKSGNFGTISVDNGSRRC